MDVKRILLISLIAVAVVASFSAVSAGWFDGLFGSEEAQDNVVEVAHISFNTTNATKFNLINSSEDEDGYHESYRDENNTGYIVNIYNFSYVDDAFWNEMVQSYKDVNLNNNPSQTVDGVVVYTVVDNSANNVGEPKYMACVQDNDLKVIVDFASSNPNETAKMASTLKFI